MPKLRVESFTVSLDGFGAGPEQSLTEPLGKRGEDLHQWMLPTRTFGRLSGNDRGSTGVDDQFVARGFTNVGAWIMGRNMFTASRGPWPSDDWRGWWGANPPYHTPVFILTHHPHASIEMDGGTTFHFVTGGIHAALQEARAAAAGKDVRVGGGVATVREYLRAGLVDEVHLAIAPMLLGSGEPLFLGLDLHALGYFCAERKVTEAATHIVLRKEDRATQAGSNV
ncbi:dihydrofolate reductase family protein [Variovorax sp. W6]|uniref:dihydrofolate reductase family protein n=1 Tax=Variovorax sp. W6 TaxID=3093895 RepID=UPI003D801EA2